jgi:hypothetical protein
MQSALVTPIAPTQDKTILEQVEDIWFPKYYYEFCWDPDTDYAENGGEYFNWSWPIPLTGGGEPLLYIEPGDGGLPVPGVAFQLGGASFGPRLECTIAESGEYLSVWYVSVSSSSLYGDLTGTYGASAPTQKFVFIFINIYE